MDIYIIKVITQLIMPPTIMLLMIMAGIIIQSRYSNHKTGKILSYSGLGLLFIFTSPLLASSITILLESTPALSMQQLKTNNAQAIVILGGGTYKDAPEYAEDTVGTGTLERIHYGAYVHKHTQLPVLVTGGRVFSHNLSSEAENMQKVMQSQLQTPVTWLEEHSRNTWENATYSYKILNTQGIKKIILVTHAIHMRRSIMSFEAAGFEVVPAPLAFRSHNTSFSIFKILPSAGAMSKLQQALHEIMGMVWYKLRYM